MNLEDFPQHVANPFDPDGKFDIEAFEKLMSLKDGSIRLLHYFSYRFLFGKRTFRGYPFKGDFKVDYDPDEIVIKICRSKSVQYHGMKDLLENGILARSMKHYEYFINPKFIFHRYNNKLTR